MVLTAVLTLGRYQHGYPQVRYGCGTALLRLYARHRGTRPPLMTALMSVGERSPRESAGGVSHDLSRFGGVPRLATFYGIVVYMYVRDHGVAHFHARHGDDEAVIEVATGTVLRGTLPPGRARLVDQWVEVHRTELLDAWSRASSGEPPGTIEPLP